ncbi:MAG: PorT family protein [Bacteroidia bacterium]|nr:PorT family protein [Bacteroidia bacterium]MDW8088779.1 outer membrane beta-barrel protein [Bacteroidia bacterium]
MTKSPPPLTAMVWGLAWAQYNLYYDLRTFNLGLNIGFNYNQVKIHYTSLQYNPPSPNAPAFVRIEGIPGLNLGLIINKKLHRYFDLRSVVSVSLQQRNIYFELADTVVKRRLEAAYLYLPLLLKYKSQFYKGYRVYILGGVQLGLNLASDKRVRDNPELIRMERTDFQWIAGVGMDFYLPNVKFSPELSYSLGFRNVYDPTGTRYGYVIRSLHMQTISLNFQFE